MRQRKTFAETVDGILKEHGLRFQGIRLTCRQCREVAFARDATTAEQFGWSALRHDKGPDYRGLCVECRRKKQRGHH